MIYNLELKELVAIKLTDLKFFRAEEIPIEEVYIDPRCIPILNGICEGAQIGVEIPAIVVDQYHDVVDGYHRIAVLKYLNATYPDEFHFDEVECIVQEE